MKKITTAIALTLAALSLSACNEGHAQTQREPKQISKGQQLIDLKLAADAGALTPDEYFKEKSKILTPNTANSAQTALVD